MALPLSGPITMSQINTELSFPATTIISLNDASVRALAGVPAGVISLSDFYGKSAQINKGWHFWGFTGATGSLPGVATTRGTTFTRFDFATETHQDISVTKPTNFQNPANNIPNTPRGTSNGTQSLFLGGNFLAAPAPTTPGMSFALATETSAIQPVQPSPLSTFGEWASDGSIALRYNYFAPLSYLAKINLSTSTLSLVNNPPNIAPANNNVQAAAMAYSAAPLGKAFSIGGVSPAPATFPPFHVKYTFSTETMVRTPVGFRWAVTNQTTPSPGAPRIGGTSCNGVVGYGFYGDTDRPQTTIGKITLSTETVNSALQLIPNVNQLGMATVNSPTDAWLMNGQNNRLAPSVRSDINRKFSFTTETLTTIPATSPIVTSGEFTVNGTPLYG